MTDSMVRTTNAWEANFNANFYSPHPNIFLFLKILQDTQTDIKILLNSVAVPKKFKKTTRTKRAFIANQIERYTKKQINEVEFVKLLSYRNVPSLYTAEVVDDNTFSFFGI